jgi:hypothetical protein
MYGTAVAKKILMSYSSSFIISKLTDAQKKRFFFSSGEGVGHKPQHLIFSVLSGIKLKFVFIQKINVDAKYQCFFIFCLLGEGSRER